MPNKEPLDVMMLQLGNPGVPVSHRSKQLIDILAGAEQGDEQFTPIAKEVFKRLSNSTVDEEVVEKAKALDQIMAQIESAPLRPATFIQASDIDGPVPHSLVIMENGEMAYITMRDHDEGKKLKIGDRVMIDAHMKILMHKAADGLYCGPESRLERKVDDRHIEVLTHQEERTVLLCSAEMVKSIESGKIKPGASIVMGAQGKIAVYALPPKEGGVNYFKFLDRGSIPDVVVDRDIGSPPRVIRQVALHIREEMTRPELRRKFKLRPCITRLLAGVSGCGKTLAVQAIHRLMYEIMEEVTGTPIAELPPRVFRMKSSQMLSMWFGESDKNIDRLFDEVEQLADKKHTGKNGREFNLPVMVVLEEADGLGRARGGDQIYDRIMTVILQRMDPNRLGLSDKMVVFLSTTNEPHIVDPAFLRRIGGSVETFGRLDQKGFSEILKKHIDGLPSEKSHKQIIASVNEHLFNGHDNGVVELTYQGQSESVIKYKRDFLTGALIDRAVQSAAEHAWHVSLDAKEIQGVTDGALTNSLDQQVLHIIHQLVPENVSRYTDLPDGARVTRIRRIPQAA